MLFGQKRVLKGRFVLLARWTRFNNFSFCQFYSTVQVLPI